MNNKIFFISILILATHTSTSQVILNADGPGETYELINSVLANPGKNVVESPDCNHSEFGRHIDEVFDVDLNKYVFQFYIHTEPDNDRCQKEDRQRNEIKTYDNSPENVIATMGEKVVYSWKFKLSDTFKPSSSFTHIHQIKSVGGPYAGLPLYTLTLRKGTPDQLELRYAETTSQSTLKKTDLSPFKGTWVEVTEIIEFGYDKSYSIEIKKVSDNTLLFSYDNSTISNWHLEAEFARPKWGIYRSLNDQISLQDEIVRFSDFSIQEITEDLAINTIENTTKNMFLFPNPASKKIEIKNSSSSAYDSIQIYDTLGRKTHTIKQPQNNIINVSGFSTGLYIVVLKKGENIVKTLTCYIKQS